VTPPQMGVQNTPMPSCKDIQEAVLPSPKEWANLLLVKQAVVNSEKNIFPLTSVLDCRPGTLVRSLGFALVDGPPTEVFSPSARFPGVGFIQHIVQGTPASYSGQLAVGDEIVAVDSVRPRSLEHLISLLDGACGTLCRLEVREQGRDASIVYLMRQCVELSAEGKPASAVGLGMQLEADTRGLRVTTISCGGPAYWSGLKVGDIILRVEDGATRELKLLKSQCHAYDGPCGTRVTLDVVRAEAAKSPRLSPMEKSLRLRLVRTASLQGKSLQVARQYRADIVKLIKVQMESVSSASIAVSSAPYSPTPRSLAAISASNNSQTQSEIVEEETGAEVEGGLDAWGTCKPRARTLFFSNTDR
jgi:hypothetical protein